VFNWLRQAGGIEDKELLRTFNCGIGMIVVVDAAHADAVTAQLKDAGETVHTVGQLQEDAQSLVTFAGQIGS
ncbi:MAG: AIR synthase-related protein, partial [Pseudomonadota bacterium]|nr:AIR synthase-related protein [Pseudomonadota bacterium]